MLLNDRNFGLKLFKEDRKMKNFNAEMNFITHYTCLDLFARFSI